MLLVVSRMLLDSLLYSSRSYPFVYKFDQFEKKKLNRPTWDMLIMKGFEKHLELRNSEIKT